MTQIPRARCTASSRDISRYSSFESCSNSTAGSRRTHRRPMLTIRRLWRRAFEKCAERKQATREESGLVRANLRISASRRQKHVRKTSVNEFTHLFAAQLLASDAGVDRRRGEGDPEEKSSTAPTCLLRSVSSRSARQVRQNTHTRATRHSTCYRYLSGALDAKTYAKNTTMQHLLHDRDTNCRGGSPLRFSIVFSHGHLAATSRHCAARVERERERGPFERGQRCILCCNDKPFIIDDIISIAIFHTNRPFLLFTKYSVSLQVDLCVFISSCIFHTQDEVNKHLSTEKKRGETRKYSYSLITCNWSWFLFKYAKLSQQNFPMHVILLYKKIFLLFYHKSDSST